MATPPTLVFAVTTGVELSYPEVRKHDRFFADAAAGTLPPVVVIDPVYGKSDDLGFNAVENPVHVHDLNATILHLLGFDHTRLTYRFQGRDYRLTDIHGELVSGIIS